MTVALDSSLANWLPEIRYTVRTVLGTAGFATDLRWYEDGTSSDIYYGPRRDVEARISIPSVPWGFSLVDGPGPYRVVRERGLPRLLFPGGPEDEESHQERRFHFGSDVLFGAFWLLCGPEEPTLERDRWDNLAASQTFVVREDLLTTPVVSLLAQDFRRRLDPAGRHALAWPWEGRRFALALTHDVDYPEIIRWIECLRSIVAGRPARSWKVATGKTDFWRFWDWVELADSLGGRPAFYFMARRGSLLAYAGGRPDAFYDITSPRFGDLFSRLRDLGCEIGLHASYHAYRDRDQIRRERERLEEVSGGPVVGNRHHYWHLDPDDPDETLRRHGEAGLVYDSSLAFETHPGFRRGICHPFRPFHRPTRSTVSCVQLPPSWMDDHFGRRRALNGIDEADMVADRIIEGVERTSGALILDYHPRGMNADFFPEYGPWLRRYAEDQLCDVATLCPVDIATQYLQREAALDASSIDRTEAP